MSKTKSFTVGASIKHLIRITQTAALITHTVVKAKAKEAKQAAVQSKQEFVKGYNSIK